MITGPPDEISRSLMNGMTWSYHRVTFSRYRSLNRLTRRFERSPHAVAHLYFAGILIHKPVRQPGSPKLGQDKRTRFYNAIQSMRLASPEPAIKIAFRA